MFEVTPTSAFFAILAPINADGHTINPGDPCTTVATDGHTYTLVELANGATVRVLAATLRVDTGAE